MNKMIDIKPGESQFFSANKHDGIDVLAKELGILDMGKIDVYTMFENSEDATEFHQDLITERRACKDMPQTKKPLRYISVNPKHPLLEKFKDRSHGWFKEEETENITFLFALKADGHDGK